MTKYEGSGVTLKWDPAGGTAYVAVGQVIDLDGPNASRNSIDSTTRDDPNYWRTFIKGWKDGGDINFGIAYDPSLSSHGSAAGLLKDFNTDGTVIPAWQMTFPDATVCTFSAFPTEWSPAGPLDDLLTADVTAKVTGAPVFP